MAAYNTITKVIRGTISGTEDSGTAASFAKAVNDYVQTLDSTSGTIVTMSTSVGGGSNGVNTLVATIVHLG